MKIRLDRFAVVCVLCVGLAACGRHDSVDAGKMHRLMPGMTYGQVVAVVGGPGRPMATGERVKGALVPEAGEAVYIWENKDGSNMTASFKARRLTAMAQYGL